MLSDGTPQHEADIGSPKSCHSLVARPKPQYQYQGRRNEPAAAQPCIHPHHHYSFSGKEHTHYIYAYTSSGREREHIYSQYHDKVREKRSNEINSDERLVTIFRKGSRY